MDGLLNWIGNTESSVKLMFTAIIGITALVVCAILITKAITAARKSKMNEVIKHLGFAALVVLIAAVGIVGTYALVNSLAPNEDILPRDPDAASVRVVHEVWPNLERGKSI